MLQRDFGVRIYKSLLSLPEKEDKKEKEKKSKKDERKDKKEDRDERKVCNYFCDQQLELVF